MQKLTVCRCDECDTSFVLQTEALEGVPEITCPLCNGEFAPPGDEESAAEDEDADPVFEE